MAATERITMTMRELDRFKVIQDVADRRLKPWQAAERLGLTTRQIRRLVARLVFIDAWQGCHAVRPGAVRVECGRVLCEQQPGQGTRGARQSGSRTGS